MAANAQVEGSKPLSELRQLDVVSELMALSSFGNAKNIIMMAAEAKGRFDEQAFRHAVKEVSDSFPMLTGKLREARKSARLWLFREEHPSLEVSVTVSDVNRPVGPEGSFNAIMDHLRPRLDRQWDLWHEPPLEIHVLRFEPEHFILVFVFHHSGADAATALKVMSEILGCYDSIVNGHASGWLSMPYVFSTSKKKASKSGKARLTYFAKQLMRDLKYRKESPAVPHGTGAADELAERHVLRIFTLEDVQIIEANVAEAGINLVDHIVVSANRALDEWNADRNVSPGTNTSLVTVNMRERFGGEDKRNYSSNIYFRSTPQQRKDIAEFARSVAEGRKKQLGRNVDLMVRRTLSMGAALVSLFPFGIRRRVADFFMRNQKFSIAVGFLGVVWPELINGRLSDDRSFKHAGQFEIVDVHGTGYKLAGNVQVNLYAFIYCRRLHLVLAVPGSLLTREEAESFMELLIRIARDTHYSV
jgi:NRPS condensation-like uncharacterized protein